MRKVIVFSILIIIPVLLFAALLAGTSRLQRSFGSTEPNRCRPGVVRP